MTALMQESILKEGIGILYQRMGAVKATKFLQLISLSKGDTLAEIEQITEKMTKTDVLNMINRARKNSEGLWKKAGLI